MFPKRKHLPTFAIVGLPLAGACVGAALSAIYPPRNPIDYWPTIGFLSVGFAVVGLLFGVLTWLWLRGRIPAVVALSAVAIPACAFGWFINGKGGNWDAAWWFGLVGFTALVLFFARSADLIARRDGDARGG
ncbi:hypothetical protein-signal peptide and transmembrane prediction [Rhodopirellula baltica SH 1]|uniref:Uncharacterized protein n=1 Tax=Rhodopirellula baltica (strain DSM 10527 / NCIMB 13988 / SH1) TaxID=243090 RepID=Q7UY28_RHOBA|nr:hypothetical protein-signal peptide and transmembrane prediction [Rhodopirellula baltica SH 1]